MMANAISTRLSPHPDPPQGDRKGTPLLDTSLGRHPNVYSRGVPLRSPCLGRPYMYTRPVPSLHVPSHYEEGLDCACVTHRTIFSGVIGISSILVPRGLSASSTAL